MPLHYSILPEHRLVYVYGVGSVGVEDLKNNLLELAADSEYRAPMLKLVDYRESEAMRLDSGDNLSFTYLKNDLAEHFHGERCALVMNSDVDFGVARVCQAHVDEDLQTGVFRDMNEALQWLQVKVTEQELQALRKPPQ